MAEEMTSIQLSASIFLSRPLTSPGAILAVCAVPSTFAARISSRRLRTGTSRLTSSGLASRFTICALMQRRTSRGAFANAQAHFERALAVARG